MTTVLQNAGADGTSQPTDRFAHLSKEAAESCQQVLEGLGEVWDLGAMGLAVLEFGQCFLKVSDRLPIGMRRGQLTACHVNCRKMAIRRPEEFTYAEGFARSTSLGFGTPRLSHAWLVDSQGLVVDRTWDRGEGDEYDGVIIPTSTLSEMERFARRQGRPLAFVTD